MKKLLALVLALAMVLSVAAAMAAGSKTTDDTTDVTTTEKTNYTGSGSNEETPKILMWKINTTDAAKELIEKLGAAKEAGEVNTVFPEELNVPAGLIVADVISVAVDPAIAEETSYTAELTGIAGVQAGKNAYTFALVDSSWFSAQTKVPADNTVDATFSQAALKAMAPAGNITLVVLTEAAE